jgi:hypothetical protein
MAKKKSKKNNQKQAEVASAPENLKTVNTTATEESPANEEAQQEPLAPPLEPSDETPVVDSTFTPDQNLESTQDTPNEDKSSMLVDAANDGETTQSTESDHVHINTAAPEDDAVEQTIQTQSDAPPEEVKTEEEGPAVPVEVADAAEHVTTVPSEDQQALPEPIQAADDASQDVPDAILDEQSLEQPAETELAATTSSIIQESLETKSNDPIVDEPEVNSPTPVDETDDVLHQGDTPLPEPVVMEVEQQPQ